jgi:hypothetical protein
MSGAYRIDMVPGIAGATAVSIPDKEPEPDRGTTMLNRSGWRCHPHTPQELTLGGWRDTLDRLTHVDCLTAVLNSRDAKVTLYIHEPNSYKNAPSGTHEFAYGWMAHKAALLCRDIFGTLTWEPVEMRDGYTTVDKFRQAFTI